ncbi:patatin [Wolbachia endosymbiont of Atemnus politus]|uniref:patatin-like phospholipase family protein n=1 Tax=Wolbachia endosymbiont of Atemnus politus TaxID=2682840 RepID=UPI001572EFF7|nr:patatin-like phospholipase family protein [Wolbachia endosymbiont of Atemnus politus]NSX83593.1 patatin [Wolbachia endosymbiont of Atemnus politus]
MTKYILSVDGGGMRGIIPAIILAEIEKKTRKPASKIFDLMVGTSTGGIVVAGLCMQDGKGKPKYSANDLVNFYQKDGPHIFKSSFFRGIGAWFGGAKYPRKNIETILDKYFGETAIVSASNKLLLTSYDIYNDCPFFFKSWKENRNFIRLKDALRSATAAPTYFVPNRLEINQKKRVLIDGGVVANNPAVCAYANSVKLFPNEDLVLLSIGTGRLFNSITYTGSKDFGRMSWVKPLLSIMFNGAPEIANYHLSNIMNNKYLRVQSRLTTAASNGMDDASAQNIRDLKQEAQAIISEDKEIIEEFCKMVA